MKVAMLSGLLMLAILITGASAQSAATPAMEYYVIVEENGNALIVITINSSGLYEIPVQGDVEVVDVTGALYILEGRTLEVSIGSTEKAVIIYQTSMLTNKNESLWSFTIELARGEKAVTVAMPPHTIVTETEPNAMIESGKIIKLHWNGGIDEVYAEYYFPPGIQLSYGTEFIYILTGIALASILAVYFTHKYSKRRITINKRDSVIRTLSMNEKNIITTMLESQGGMKRSHLERKTGISKSSLAATLKNLERKKIIEVDRTFASHYVKFTEWFNGL